MLSVCTVFESLVLLCEDRELLAGGVGNSDVISENTHATTSAASHSRSNAAPGLGRSSKVRSLGRVGTVAGQTIQAAGLRGLADAFLVAIERGNCTLHAVAPTEVLIDGDVLWFTGTAQAMVSLRKIPGAACSLSSECRACLLARGTASCAFNQTVKCMSMDSVQM
jgi:hypothetical protein